MYNERMERSAGWSGIAFIVVVLVAAFLPGPPPTPDTPVATVSAWLDAHHFLWVLSGWLIYPGVLFYLWWVVQLRAFLRLAPQLDDGLPTYMLVGAILGAAIVTLIATDQIVLGLRPSSVLGPAIVQLLFDTFNALGAMVFIPTTILVFAASHSGLRHSSIPKALAYLGYLTCVGCAVSTLSVFSATGFMAIGGIGTVLMGLLPFTIWVLWVSAVMIRAPRSGQSSH